MEAMVWVAKGKVISMPLKTCVCVCMCVCMCNDVCFEMYVRNEVRMECNKKDEAILVWDNVANKIVYLGLLRSKDQFEQGTHLVLEIRGFHQL